MGKTLTWTSDTQGPFEVTVEGAGEGDPAGVRNPGATPEEADRLEVPDETVYEDARPTAGVANTNQVSRPIRMGAMQSGSGKLRRTVHKTRASKTRL